MDVLIAYHSDYGNTERLAQAVAAGLQAAAPDAGIVLRKAAETGLDDLVRADLLVFGTPVHMGSMAWPMKRLIDDSAKLWLEGALEGKLGAAFATGGGFGAAGGGIEQTLIGLHANFLEHGMIVLGCPKSIPGYADAGLHWGLAARTGNHEGMPEGLDEAALAAGRAWGSHLAETAERLLG
ncbi:MAG: flavodoxin domain-containing protein [Mariprofundaceae bacterium]